MSEKDLKRTRKTLYHNVEKQPIFGYNTNIANTSNERMFQLETAREKTIKLIKGLPCDSSSLQEIIEQH